MLQQLLSIIVLLSMLTSPVATEFQPEVNRTNTVHHSVSNTMTHCTHKCNTHDCCDKQCSHCSCGFAHFSMVTLPASEIYRPPLSLVKTAVSFDIISRIHSPELPPPLI